MYYFFIFIALALIAYILFFNKKGGSAETSHLKSDKTEPGSKTIAETEDEKALFFPDAEDLKIGTIQGKSFAYLKEIQAADKKHDSETLVEEIYFENMLEEEHVQSAEEFIQELKGDVRESETDMITVRIESSGAEESVKEEEGLSLQEQEELLKQKREIEDFYSKVDKNINDANKLFEGIKNAYTGKKKM